MIEYDFKKSKFVTISFFIALFMLISHGIGSGMVGGTYSFSKMENQKYFLFGNSNRDVIPGKQWH